MSIILFFTLIWFLLPIISEVIRHITTPAMAKVSMEVDGFWDVMEDPTGSHTRKILMMDEDDLARLNAEYPLSSAVEPPKGDWRNKQ